MVIFAALPRKQIESGTIVILPECAADDVALQLRGYADCSVASLFAASDQTFPALFFAFSLLSFAAVAVWKRTALKVPEAATALAPALSPSLVQQLRLPPCSAAPSRLCRLRA